VHPYGPARQLPRTVDPRRERPSASTTTIFPPARRAASTIVVGATMSGVFGSVGVEGVTATIRTREMTKVVTFDGDMVHLHRVI
jgi:hypothetical protein